MIAEKNENAQFLPYKLPTHFLSLQMTKMVHPNFEKTCCNCFDEQDDVIVLATGFKLMTGRSSSDGGRSEDGPGMKEDDLDRVQIPEEDDSKEGSENKTELVPDFGFR